MKVAIYSRVSTQHKEQKPEVQESELRRYCKARGFKIVHEFTDRARGSTDDRPGLKQLFKLVRAREVDAVVVVKLDRLFRSLKHLVNTLSEFDALGVKFIATRDQVDLTTPAGRMFVQILGSLAEFERELIRERVMVGLEHAKSQGKRLGRPPGIDRSQEVYKLRKQGLSQRQIQSKLRISKGAIYRALCKISSTAKPNSTSKSHLDQI